MKKSMIMRDEWLFTLWRPAKTRRGRVIVTLDNVEAHDRAFAEGLRKLVEIWVNAEGRGGRR